MFNYLALKDELETDDYDGLSDAASVAKLNEQSVTVYTLVPTGEVHNFLVNNNIYGKLLTAYHTHPAQQIREIAETAVDTVMGQIPQIDLASNSAIAQGGAALVQVGVLTQAELDSVLDLAKRTTSRAQQLVGVDVTEQDIARARLQDKVEAVQELQLRIAAGANRATGLVAPLLAQLESGVDVELPTWAEIEAAFSEVTP